MKNNIFKIIVVLVILSVPEFADCSAMLEESPSNRQAITQINYVPSRIIGNKEDFDALKQAYEKDWSNYDIAFELFNGYLAQRYDSPYCFKNAAIILINLKAEIDNPSATLPSTQISYYKEIKNSLETRVRQTPRNADYLAVLAGLEELFNNHTKALQYASQAAKYKAKIYLPLFAYLEQISGNFETANKLYGKLPNSKYLDLESIFSKTANDIQLGKQDEALKTCRTLIDENKRPNDAISLGYYALLSKNASDAEIINFLEPNNRNVPYEKIYTKYAKELLINSPHKRHAELMMKSALAINPNDADIYLTMADAYNQIGDKTKTIELLQKVRNLPMNSIQKQKYNALYSKFQK